MIKQLNYQQIQQLKYKFSNSNGYQYPFNPTQSKQMSASKNLMSGIKVKQTMFEFLKRKKQTQLESSFNKNLQTQRKSLHQSKYSTYRKQSHHRMHSTLDYEDFVLDSADHHRSNRQQTQRASFIQSASITPRKISFRLDENQDREHKQKSTRKALVEMISPLKNQNSQLLTSRSRERAVTSLPKKGILKKKSQKTNGNTSELFIKRKINQGFQGIRNMVNSYYKSGHAAKIKADQIARFFYSTNRQSLRNEAVLKQLGQLKFQIKGLQKSLNIFDLQDHDADQIIDRIQHLITQQLSNFQSSLGQNFKKSFEQQIQKIQSNKNQTIQELRNDNYRLERLNEKLQNKIQKLQKQLETIQNQFNQRQENFLQKLQNSNNLYEQKLSQKQEDITFLKDDIVRLRTEKIQLERQLKNSKYGQQKQINMEETTRLQQFHARQQYLLKQIQKLKEQFNIDIDKLHKLYQTKNEQLHKRIHNLTQQLEQLEQQKYQRKCDRQITDRVLADANINKQQVGKLRNKNEEMLRDLYKLNEKLYQHWIALKDIKTLGSRLSFYHHLQGIYRDLAFNERLF